jgi:hypothetical protein
VAVPLEGGRCRIYDAGQGRHGHRVADHRAHDEWKTMKTSLTTETFEVATDLFYITVVKQ